MTLLDTIPSISTSYNDTSVKNGQEYFYRVSANNKDGESRMGNIISVVPHGKPFPPEALKVIANKSLINLTWNASYNNGDVIVQYNIYRQSKAENWTLLASLAPINTSYCDGNVTEQEQYMYRITAVNSKGESGPSNEVTSKLIEDTKTERIPNLASSFIFIALMIALLKRINFNKKGV